nr:MAG TPA: hypothetical protein [Caudoviricetes sp.]
MKFLDTIGLAYFWEKIKSWVGKNYLSLNGGDIDGSINIYNPDSRINISEKDKQEKRYTRIDKSGITIGTQYGTEDVNLVEVNSSHIIAPEFKKKDGEQGQVLMADGSVTSLGVNIPVLDSNGNVPLSQLGNLDTTVAEVVTALPTTNIKKHIYLIKDASGVTQNQYEEYIYTGNTSATYDASKWEKLGDFHATVDLADYAKKSETISNIEILTRTIQGSALRDIYLHITRSDSNTFNIDLPAVTGNTSGVMLPSDKLKLDRFDFDHLDSDTIVHMNAILTFARVDQSPSSAILIVETLSGQTQERIIQAATSSLAGVMSASDKAKLDGISSGATADSAITTAEIDALFA